jgi:predicted AlkP superfamily pyrophosphatase or phosphodiesterase
MSLENKIRYEEDYPGKPTPFGEILLAFKAMILRGGPPDEDPAQHGSAYDYDRRIPIIFWGPWQGQRRMDPARTVDIAPTLANELGIKPEEPLDGFPLRLSRQR